MVGVAGRSKGCRTCRRRKKGCDLKMPECGQCTERGFTCGGYDRDRVFIHQNAVHNTKSVSHKQSEADLKGYENSGYRPAFFQLVQRSTAQPIGFSIIFPQTLARSAFTEKITELYLDKYLPSDDSNKALMSKQGLPSVLPFLTAWHDALHTTLVAVYCAITGLTHGDEALTEQGKRMYVKSLQNLNRALRDKSMAGNDALLAVPRLMGLFEVLFGSGIDARQQGRSWQCHAAGDEALMEARGPDAFTEGIPHLLFIEGRLAPIIHAVGIRKATMLNSGEWKTVPWKIHPKTPKDALLDILASIPEVLERFDNLRFSPASGRDTQINNLRAKCQDIDAELDMWLATNSTSIVEPDEEAAPVPIEYTDMLSAHTTVIYSSICILLYSTLLDLNALAPTHPPGFLLPERNLSAKHPRTHARHIARSAPYFFKPSSGIWGAVTITFPVGVTLMSLHAAELEADRPYTALIYDAWRNPRLPNAIKGFLVSIRGECQRRVAARLAQKSRMADTNKARMASAIQC